METQNEVGLLRMTDGRVQPEILCRVPTLAKPAGDRARQAAVPVHLHPSGGFLYSSNRAKQTEDVGGTAVFKGGENGIVVYAIDARTGLPSPVQHVDSRGIHLRTFHIDPSGRLLVAEHNLPVTVRDGQGLTVVNAGLSIFRIGEERAAEVVLIARESLPSWPKKPWDACVKRLRRLPASITQTERRPRAM